MIVMSTVSCRMLPRHTLSLVSVVTVTKLCLLRIFIEFRSIGYLGPEV